MMGCGFNRKRVYFFKIVLVIALALQYGFARESVSADITPDVLKDKGVLIYEVDSETIVCVFNLSEGENSWFLIKGMAENRLLGNNLSQLSQVYQMNGSADKTFLAILSVGEGHPMLEVIDLHRLINDYQYTTLQVVDPYPGTISITGWEGSQLMIESDMPLTLRKEDGRVDPALIMPEAKTFALNPLSGAMSAVTFDKAELSRYYVSQLAEKERYVRIAAVEGLKALADPATLPLLQTAFSKESDREVQRALLEAIDVLQNLKKNK